jgi:hypothetical protein
LRILFALSQSQDAETATAANRAIVAITVGSGLRGRKRERFLGMMRTVRACEQLYENDREEAAQSLVRCIADFLTASPIRDRRKAFDKPCSIV